MGWVGALWLVFATPARADERPLADVVAQAQRERKPILLEFSAVWCGPCAMFERYVLPVLQTHAVLEPFVFVRYDESKSRELVKQFAVKAFPTFVLLDENGKLLLQHRGLFAAAPDEFAGALLAWASVARAESWRGASARRPGGRRWVGTSALAAAAWTARCTTST